MTATERRALAREMYADGLNPPAIAKRLGVRRQTAWTYVRDLLPEPGDGRRSCRQANRRWEADSIVAALQQLADAQGHQPSANQIIRRESGEVEVPAISTVFAIFGTWNAALEAAGFVQRAPHSGTPLQSFSLTG